MRLAVIAFALFFQQTAPPTVGNIQSWYEAGEYQQVVDQGRDVTAQKARYLLASSYEKLGQIDEARAEYRRLVARGETDPWALIGRAANALLTDGSGPTTEEVDAALRAAGLAIAMLTPDPATGAPPEGPASAVAHYQMGLVQGHRNDYVSAAAAFDVATTLDPTFAYAYYYGGLANSRIDRPDQMVINFERFLQLAPEAPEASRVRSLMRGVRGR